MYLELMTSLLLYLPGADDITVVPMCLVLVTSLLLLCMVPGADDITCCCYVPGADDVTVAVLMAGCGEVTPVEGEGGVGENPLVGQAEASS
jgi:hypothetical protein